MAGRARASREFNFLASVIDVKLISKYVLDIVISDTMLRKWFNDLGLIRYYEDFAMKVSEESNSNNSN